MDSNNARTESVSFSLFGENFNLYCKKEQKDALTQAIENIKQRASKMLRDNPTLTPQQTAILIAVNAEADLQEYLKTATPFENSVITRLNKIKTILQRNEHAVK